MGEILSYLMFCLFGQLFGEVAGGERLPRWRDFLGASVYRHLYLSGVDFFTLVSYHPSTVESG